MSVLVIARYTLLEAVRRRVLLAMVVLSLAYLGLFAVGFSLLYQTVSQNTARTGAAMPALFTAGMTVLGFYALSFLTSLLAVFASAGAIAGDVESGVLQAVLARPVRRRDIILGKWVGQAGLITVYVVAMTAGMVAASQIAAGYSPPQPAVAGALMAGSALTLLSLGFLGSTFLPTLANGVAVFLLFGLARAASLIETIGQAVKSDAMVNIGIVVSLLIPSDALWQGASFYLQPPAAIMAQNMAMGGTIPFAGYTPPTMPMLIWSALYMLAGLLGAILILDRRDL